MRPTLLACLLVLLAAPAFAAEPPLELRLPLDCEPGVSCWIPRYVDQDPGPGVKDFACGTLTGPAHSGTDFAIRDMALLRAGVPVVASAPGVVRGLRDGMDDVSVEVVGQAAIEGRNCGNGVVLTHPGGWETQYCHMKKGSVVVAMGQKVEAGQKLGEVGLSGETSYPHVHLSVRQGSQQVDPFRGLDGGPACGMGTTPLWAPDLLPKLAYRPVLLIDMGFAAGQAKAEEAYDGKLDQKVLPLDAPALVLWMDGFGFKQGDRIAWRITGPDGAVVFDTSLDQDRDRARIFRFAGRKRPPEGWAPGRYEGTITVTRPSADYTTTLEREVELR